MTIDARRGLRIGLTYDLRSEYLAEGYGELETAEFDRDDTIEALERTMRELGHQPVRIGRARRLVERLAAGERWDLVFNICEGFSGAARESQVPAILDVYEIPYTFADPLVLAVCLDKAVAKLVVANAGVPTPRFAVVASEVELRALVDELSGSCSGALRFPLFAKPIAEGTGKGVTPASRIASPEELSLVALGLLEEHRQPVLVEEFLPGREFTVAILGEGDDAEIIGTQEVLLSDRADPGVYSYRNKEHSEELVDYRLVHGRDDDEVRRVEEVALGAWRALGGRDAGRVDVRSDARGEPAFIEANPLAGIHPEHSDLPLICTAVGLSYRELIARILESAFARAERQSRERARRSATTRG